MDELVEQEAKKLDVRYDQGSDSSATFIIKDEDHTLGNALRYALMKNPKVEFAGYSIPHPLDNAINIRVQTTGAPATDVVEEGLDQLQEMSATILAKFDIAVALYDTEHAEDRMEQ